MPTYFFACRCCGFEFEAVRSIKDDCKPQCPKCFAAEGCHKIPVKNVGGFRTPGADFEKSGRV